MPLTANVLYVSDKLNSEFDMQKCVVVEQLRCFNRDALALVLTADRIRCASEIVRFEGAQVELLESAEFSWEAVGLLRQKMRLIVDQYDEDFA